MYLLRMVRIEESELNRCYRRQMILTLLLASSAAVRTRRSRRTGVG